MILDNAPAEVSITFRVPDIFGLNHGEQGFLAFNAPPICFQR